MSNPCVTVAVSQVPLQLPLFGDLLLLVVVYCW